ncbi:MAG TPA: FAD:protein FMN transferase [Kiritimatiellia bacterium]|jgi:thiamine biosynthesis lipoprotein|nr:FAD:protein FMN transferase [Kiritimatiellia bacterium]HOR97258.1 FAD:protein FMN transferase [Kiritimatiellia bacterium]HPC48662.1 FAD:protein FMN transferase [Kiritimatiellia bacterium]HPK36884.1 FAD:protein FMN transferase [Kiritimatiellia bacterium]HPW75296.1 FAD:protein FMN transferase [Kiritimatiellia bacterium]
MTTSFPFPFRPVDAPYFRIAVLCAVLAGGCSRQPAAPLRIEWLCMGTVAAVQCADRSRATDARDQAQAVFAELDREFSAWHGESVLSAVNRAAGSGQATAVSACFATVLQTALDASEASGGAFNPMIGPVMQAWGFNGAMQPPEYPDDRILNAAFAMADWRAVICNKTTDGAEVRLPVAGMSLDLGAIAKGYAVDLAWERLKAAGHTNLLIDLGGNLRALGEAAPGRGGWRTGVRNPFQSNTMVGKFLMRHGEAVATSGNYERFVEIQGLRYAHILDGRTGLPVTGMASVTVIAPDAMTADLLSTTLFILGPEAGVRLLSRYPGCEALWIPDTPDQLTLLSTPGFADRLTPHGKTPYALSVIR